jgi:hypothetical protein
MPNSEDILRISMISRLDSLGVGEFFTNSVTIQRKIEKVSRRTRVGTNRGVRVARTTYQGCLRCDSVILLQSAPLF